MTVASPSSPSTIRMHASTAVDWLLHCWLPDLLDTVGDTPSSSALRSLPEVTRDALANRYALASTSRVLRAVRARLREALHHELHFANAQGVPIHDLTYGDALPHLNQITGFAAAATRSAHVGQLTRTCTQLAVAVVVAREANDNDRGSSCRVPAAVTRLYERDLSVLVQACTAEPGATVAATIPRATKKSSRAPR